jgi:hypothetical protein
MSIPLLFPDKENTLIRRYLSLTPPLKYQEDQRKFKAYSEGAGAGEGEVEVPGEGAGTGAGGDASAGAGKSNRGVCGAR